MAQFITHAMSKFLIHIGYIKSGSTYLQAWFDKHPAMLYKYHGLGGFYNTRDLSWYAESEEQMHECFVISSEHLSVWKSDSDIVGMRKGFKQYDIRKYQQKLCDTLYSLYPTGKVLIVTRGFTTMFNSMYAQYVFNGGTYNFEDFYNSIGDNVPHIFDYSHVVSIYRQRFGHDNVIVMPYEMLRDDPEAFTDYIEKAMGMQRTFKFSKEKINATRDKKILNAHLIVSNALYHAVQILPYKAQRVVYGLYMKQNYSGKLSWLYKFVAARSGKEISLGNVTGILKPLEGKADLLKNEPLFQPYLKEYLL